jgi:hypothetical protein
MSYEEAKQKHYGQGEAGLSPDYISAYAMMHPWEDFAETFAHLLHIVDTLATIGGFGLHMRHWPGSETDPSVRFDPYDAALDDLLGTWRPFAFAGNAINRAMGQPDLYPFQLTEPVVAKLAYVHALVRKARHDGRAGKPQHEEA